MNYKKMLALGFVGSLTLWGCGDDTNETNNTPEPVQPNNSNNGTNNNTSTNNSNNGSNNATNNGSNNSTNNGNNQTEPDPNSVTLPDPADFDYSAEAIFTLGGIIGGYDGVLEKDSPGTVVCTEGCDDNLMVDGAVTLYPVDSGFGFILKDFIGATQKPRDGVFDDGWVGEILDADGNPIGIAVSNAATATFKTGPRAGAWCSGVGASPVKCVAEHYVVAEHVLTCHETVPYRFYDPFTGMPTADYLNCRLLDDTFDRPMSELETYQYDIVGQIFTSDYAMRLGDHPGEYKMVWGDTDKRPNDIRLQTTIELPADFKSGEYRVTRAELAVVHTITNNPNDQLRPEDLSNEGPTGKIPDYTVDADGRWLSARDCIEGDGDFIPAGTVFRNPAFADPDHFMEDVREGFTNAWYTSVDRDPFIWTDYSSPRWRLKAPKMGQDLPELEIPAVPCTPYPLKKDQKKYERGDITVTHINLLEPEDGVILLGTSDKFTTPDPEDLVPGSSNITLEGAKLTEDFDVVIYIKGDKNPVRLYKAVLYMDYEPAN